MSSSSSVEDPVNRAFGEDILIVPDEVHLLPDIAQEAINMLLAEIVSAVEPIRAENADVEVDCAAFAGGIESVHEGSAVVPLEVVERGADGEELVLDDVEIAAIGPIVPEIDEGEGAGVVHEEDGVELERPWRGSG